MRVYGLGASKLVPAPAHRRPARSVPREEPRERPPRVVGTETRIIHCIPDRFSYNLVLNIKPPAPPRAQVLPHSWRVLPPRRA